MANSITLLAEVEAQARRRLDFIDRLQQEQLRLTRLFDPLREIRKQAETFQRLLDPLHEFNRLRDRVSDFRSMVDSLRLNSLRDLGSEFRRMTEALQPPKLLSSALSSLASIQPPALADSWLTEDRFAALVEIPVRRRSRRDELEEEVGLLRAEVDALKAAISPPPAEPAHTENDDDEDLHTGQYL